MGDKKQGSIPVRVHLPERVNETLRQEKINLLYDLLKPTKGNDKK